MQPLALGSTRAASPSTCAAQLLDVAPLVMRRIRNEMRRRTMPGLSLPQFRALNYLRKHPGSSLSDVAQHLGLTLPSTSRLVQRLVTHKVVVRRVGRDRRCNKLSLTERGRLALASARMETFEQLAEILKPLSHRDLATVSVALLVLERAFAESGDDVNLP